ncbi:MAG: 4Fe-4S dicluster domain-containing protein [Thermodesulfobacteriota bacterium]
MAITKKDIHPELKAEIAETPGGEYIKRCFACGACTGICPVSRVVLEFDPRKIIHMAVLGLKKRLFTSHLIWHCARCQTCTFVCPQDVRFSEVVGAMRSLALKSGLVDISKLEDIGKLAVVEQSRCVGCLTCVRVCPFKAPHVGDEGVAFIDPVKCRACGICVAECPARAIRLKESEEDKRIAGDVVSYARAI